MTDAGYPPEWDDIVAPADGLALAVVDPPETPEVRRDHRAEWRRRKRRVYAKACELREQLRALLGGKCSNEKCGATEHLEFHHPNGRDWEPREKNLMQRMRLYERDHERGQLALLCSPCNGRDGAIRGYWQRRRRNRHQQRKRKR